MIIDILKNLFMVFYKFLKLPLICLVILFIVFLLIYSWWIFYYKVIKKVKTPYGEHYKIKEDLLVVKIWKAIKLSAHDRITRNPGEMSESDTGIYLFCGEQGSGKTSTMINRTMMKQEEYPNIKVIGNAGYKFQDRELKEWKDLLQFNNGANGVIVMIDEISSLLNSRSFKDFPPEMLTVSTQNRKNRRAIYATTQRFEMTDKVIRTQCKEYINCHTFLGTLCVCIRWKPIFDEEGNVSKRKYKGYYVWVHNNKLRNSYDTYKAINRLTKTGFVPRSEQIGNNVFSEKPKMEIEIKEKKGIRK